MTPYTRNRANSSLVERGEPSAKYRLDGAPLVRVWSINVPPAQLIVSGL